jgi:hypothetical protein
LAQSFRVTIRSIDYRLQSFTLGLLSFAVFHGRAANAAPRSVRETIDVHPGVTCLDGATLREQVRSWLDADSVDGDFRVEVEGSDHDARMVSIRLWRRDELIAQRGFAPGPSDCAQMHAVVGLAIALALKVSLRDELLGEPRPPPRTWLLGAAGSFAWEVVPGAAGGAVVWLEKLFPQHFSAQLRLSGLIGGSNEFEQVSGEFTASSIALEAAACALPLSGERVRGQLCVGFEARALRASGSGFATSKETVLDWFSVSNSAGISVRVAPRWWLTASAGVVMPLHTVQISVVDPSGRVVDTLQSSAAGGLFSLGGAYEF